MCLCGIGEPTVGIPAPPYGSGGPGSDSVWGSVGSGICVSICGL
jgi:hypothetical protein